MNLLKAIKIIDQIISEQCGELEMPRVSQAHGVAQGPAQFNLAALVDSANGANCFVEYKAQQDLYKPPGIILHLEYLKARIANQKIHPLEVLFLKRLFDYANQRGMIIYLWRDRAPHKQAVYSAEEVWTQLKNTPTEFVNRTEDEIKQVLALAGESSSSYRIILSISSDQAIKYHFIKNNNIITTSPAVSNKKINSYSNYDDFWVFHNDLVENDSLSIKRLIIPFEKSNKPIKKVKINKLKIFSMQEGYVVFIIKNIEVNKIDKFLREQRYKQFANYFYDYPGIIGFYNRETTQISYYYVLPQGDYTNITIADGVLYDIAESRRVAEKILLDPSLPEVLNQERVSTGLEDYIDLKVLSHLDITLDIRKIEEFNFNLYQSLVRLDLTLDELSFGNSTRNLDLIGLIQLKKLCLKPTHSYYRKLFISLPAKLEVLILNEVDGEVDVSNAINLQVLKISSLYILPPKISGSLTKVKKLRLDGHFWRDDYYSPILREANNVEELCITIYQNPNISEQIEVLSSLVSLDITIKMTEERITLDFSKNTCLTELTINIVNKNIFNLQSKHFAIVILPASIKKFYWKSNCELDIQGETQQLEELSLVGRQFSDLTSDRFPKLKILLLRHSNGKQQEKNISALVDFPKPLDIVSLKNIKFDHALRLNASCLYYDGKIQRLPNQQVICSQWNIDTLYNAKYNGEINETLTNVVEVAHPELLLGHFLFPPPGLENAAKLVSTPLVVQQPIVEAPTISSKKLVTSMKLSNSATLVREINSDITLPDDPEYMAACFNLKREMVSSRDMRVKLYNRLVKGILKSDNSDKYNLNLKKYWYDAKTFNYIAAQNTAYRGKIRIKKGSHSTAYPLATDFITYVEDLVGLIIYDEQGKLIDEKNIKLIFCPQRYQYFIEIKKSPKVFFCEYLIKKTEKEVKPELIIAEHPLLDDTTKKIIEKHLAGHVLMQIIENESSVIAKLAGIKRYLNNIPNTATSIGKLKKIKNDVEFHLELIKNNMGACRHRAYVFMLLAHYLQVPALFECNDIHAFCSVPFGDTLVIYDLGGTMTRINYSGPLQNQTSLISSEGSSASSSQSILNHASSSAAPQPQPIANAIDSGENKHVDDASSGIYDKVFSNLTEQKILTQWQQIKANDPALILHSPLITAQSLYANFLANAKPAHAVFYIHNSFDFSRFLNPKGLIDGQISEVDGPLKHAIESEQPITLIINGNEFSDAELVIYKSIGDTTPTLYQYALAHNIQIIWLIKENRPLSDAFSSRLTPYCYSIDSIVRLDQDQQNELDSIEVDLYHRFDWENLLFYPEVEYRVLPDRSATRVIQGDSPIEKAIRAGKKLKIINPPRNNPEFNLFYFRFMTERKVLINGEWKDLTESSISIELAEQAIEDITQIKIIPAPEDEKRRIYLSANTFYQLYEDMTYHSEGAIEKNNGLLSHYQDGDVFYLQGCIPLGLWETLIGKVKKYYPDKTFYFSFAPGSFIEEKSNLSPLAEASQAVEEVGPVSVESVFFTNDPFYLAKKIKLDEQAVLITVSPETSVSDLFCSMTLNEDMLRSNKLTAFSTFEKKLLTMLRAGKKIVLQGTLSQDLYNFLQVFLREDGRYFANEQFEKLPGKLILVMPEAAKERLALQGTASQYIPFNWDHYSQDIDSLDRENFQRLRGFYEKSQFLPFYTKTLREPLQWTFHKIQHALAWLRDRPAGFHNNNPIKSFLIYDYQKDSAEYAFLNILGKCYFFSSLSKYSSIEVNKNKLFDLIKQEYGADIYDCFENIKTTSDSFLFKLLNCFNSEIIQDLLEPLDEAILATSAFPGLSKQVKDKLFDILYKIMNESFSQNRIKNKEESKQQKQVEFLLSTNQKLITLMGDEGSGKSYLVRELLRKQNEKYIIFDISQFDSWLAYPGDKKAILLADEFNLVPDEHWHQLQCLIENPEAYPQQVVVATGNPPHFSLRHRHHLFLQSAHTVWFNQPSPQQLKIQFLTYLNQRHTGDASPHEDFEQTNLIMANTMMHAFKIYNQYNPWQKISYRDYENVIARYNLLKTTTEEKSELILIQKALMMELLFSLPCAEARTELQACLSLPDVQADGIIKLRPGFAIPAARQCLYETLRSDLKMRETVPDEVIEGLSHKQGVLIEGSSGIGKSVLYEEILKAEGYSQDNPNLKQKYYKISSDVLDAMKIKLEQAFHEGAVVILDELNLYPDLEELLNQLMCGYDSQGKTSINKGFFVLASQNSCMDAGREAQSAALRSRFHLLRVGDYNEKEQTALLNYYRVDHPQAFLKSWSNTGGHTRTFFRALNEISPVLRLAATL